MQKQGLSVVPASVLGMAEGTVLDSAQAEVAVACAALKRLQTIDYWQIPELDLLAFASLVEGVARLGYTAQVRVAGEVDTRQHRRPVRVLLHRHPCSGKP